MPKTMTQINPFDEPLRQLEAKIADLSQKGIAAVGELQWFDSNNEPELKSSLNTCCTQVDQLRQKHDDTESSILSSERKRRDIRTKTRSRLNPKNWFDSGQVQLRRTQKELKQAHKNLEVERKSFLDQICRAERDLDNAEAMFERYSSFDLADCKERLSRIKTDLVSLRVKAKRIAEQKNIVDQALKPVVDQMHQYMELKQQTETIRNRATNLDWELSNADNSYERAMVHKQCEAEFNVGSPRKVIGNAERDLRRITRDYEKTYNRAVEIGKKAARRIDAIVIDGINLCYENSKFIGLSALEALVPVLQDDYKVTVVFDAAIRSMVKANDKTISGRFGDRIQVHIMATKGKADETVLDLGENDNYTYILSNDRFAEYNDKQVIRDNRVMRHEIVNNRIMVYDLGVNASY